MVATNFEASLKLVLAGEGGNVDNPRDPGGRTSRGITQRVYNAYRKRLRLPGKDVYQASENDVAVIYHQSYWEPYADKLPIGVDYLYFDMAVNAGTSRAVEILQKTVGVKVDGVVGPVTLAAVDDMDPGAIVNLYTVHRLEFYKSLGKPEFIRGWTNRANNAENAALDMIGDDV